MTRTLIASSIVLSTVLVSACAPAPASRSPYTAQAGIARDPQHARDLHARASRLIAERGAEAYAEAEPLLRAALAADLYHGPAHNNLGIILLGRGELYEAATEFEWARKLMPGHPDPRVNLAIALERAGKTDDALAAYDSALAVAPGCLPAVQGKAGLQVRRNRHDRETHALLDDIALRGDAAWREWAALWKAKLGSATTSQ